MDGILVDLEQSAIPIFGTDCLEYGAMLTRFPASFAIIFVACMWISGCSKIRKVDHSVEKLTATLKDKDANMRYWAAESIGQFGAEAAVAVPDLATALTDESKMVRMGAAYALAEVGPAATSARDALTHATQDPEKEVRDAAVYALGKLNGKATPNPKR